MREEMTTLGESCQFFNGKAHEKDIDAEGKYVVVNSKFISRDGKVRKYTGKQMFPLFEDDIVMVMSDVPNGKALAKCYIIEEDDKYSLNQRICAIRTTEFNIRFLYYQLNRHPYFLAFNNGENQSNLRKGDILNCPLWKPSIEIQEQIVELLDEALEQINQAQQNIKKNIENAEELLQSKLNNVFSLTNHDFPIKTVGEISKILNGGTPKTKITEYWNGQIAWITPADLGKLNSKYVHNTSRKISDLGLQKSSAKLFPSNSIVLSTRAPIGHIAINTIEMSTNQGCRGIVPKEEVLTDYLYYFLKGNVKLLNELGTGTTFKELSTKSLASVKIPLPTFSKQENISKNLDELHEELDAIFTNYSNKILKLEKTKKSILQKAFAGELTRNQLTTI